MISKWTNFDYGTTVMAYNYSAYMSTYSSSCLLACAV